MANNNSMNVEPILIIDGVLNLFLGILLLLFTVRIVSFLGVPEAAIGFYPNILGAVFVGITIALFIEAFRGTDGAAGLGFAGAVSINLCGGSVLALWLIFGNLELPLRGAVFLWILVALLASISVFEIVMDRVARKKPSDNQSENR